MTGRPVYHLVPAESGAMVPAKLMGMVGNYAMVRRPYCAPFVVTLREWHEGQVCDPTGIPLRK